jgi:hypothetical protein
MVRSMSSHKTRFKKWQQLTPEQTQFLSSSVETHLIPLLEKEGFYRVDHTLHQTDWPVSGREIELERWSDSTVDSVTFNFDKYGSPRFQVHLSKRLAEQPHDFVWSSNLVARGSKYLYFWGKPWWVPISLWSHQASLRTIANVECCLGQVLAFISTGERGNNISPAVT